MDFNPGDKVRVIRTTLKDRYYDIREGDIYKVCGVNYCDDPVIRVDGRRTYLRPYQLEKVADDEPVFSEGNYVRLRSGFEHSGLSSYTAYQVQEAVPGAVRVYDDNNSLTAVETFKLDMVSDINTDIKAIAVTGDIDLQKQLVTVAENNGWQVKVGEAGQILHFYLEEMEAVLVDELWPGNSPSVANRKLLEVPRDWTVAKEFVLNPAAHEHKKWDLPAPGDREWRKRVRDIIDVREWEDKADVWASVGVKTGESVNSMLLDYIDAQDIS